VSSTTTLLFRGELSEDAALDVLYGKESGFDPAPDQPLHSIFGVSVAIAGLVIMTGQLAAALWQIRQANAAKAAADRPLQISLLMPSGKEVPLPTKSHEALAAALAEALTDESSDP